MAKLLKRNSEVLDSQISRPKKMMAIPNSPSVIKSLPKDLLIEVLAKVASSSYTNLIQAKLATKDFLDASNDGYIFRHASLENFTKLLWNNSPEFWSFIKTCNDNDNSQSLYRKGMLEFFTHCKETYGLAYLKQSAQRGCVDACYVYGNIMYASDSKDEGLEFLKNCEIKSGYKMSECRRTVKDFIWDLWVKNKISMSKKDFEVHCSNIKGNCIINEKINGWDWKDEDDHYGEHTCEGCKWNSEVLRFCKMLRTGSYS